MNFEGFSGSLVPVEKFWLTTLEGKKEYKFEEINEAETQLVLKRATLNPNCNDKERVVVEIQTFNHEGSNVNFKDKTLVGPLCSLNCKNSCSVSLDSLSLSPPVIFRLSQGEGPVTLTGNLIKHVDPTLRTDDSEDDEEMEEMSDEQEAEVENEPEEQNDEKNASSSEAESEPKPVKKSKKKSKKEKKPEPEAEPEPVKEEVTTTIKSEITEDSTIETSTPNPESTKKSKKKKKKDKKMKAENKENQLPDTENDADVSKMADTTMDGMDSDEPQVKKVKLEEDEKDQDIKPKKRNAPFRRVISENIKVDDRLNDNSYLAKKGARTEEYGHQAAKDLLKVRGKDFTREKNKRKRGAYKGGKIDQNVIHSIKFDNSDDSD